MVSPSGPLELLARKDKWFLGCGDGILFAPPFPVWLDAPGFWDEGTIYQYMMGPLFTVTLLDEDGAELPLQVTERHWTPAALAVTYRRDGIRAVEHRCVLPGGVFASEWEIECEEPRSLHMVAWTAQVATGKDLDLSSVEWRDGLIFTRTLRDRRQVPLDVRAELKALGAATSWTATLSEGSALQPHWRFTPFREQWGKGGLPRQVRLEGIAADGLMYGAVHRALPPNARRSDASFTMRLAPADPAIGSTLLVDSVVAVSGGALPSREAGSGAICDVSRRRWESLFALAPTFRCSDPYLERYWWYRWYGLWLNAIEAPAGNYSGKTICEGIGFFHQPITYSAQCHVRELRWLSDPAWARGVLRSIFQHQRPDGSLHGRIYLNHLQGTDFYHANWGDALLALDVVWPDDAFVRELYPALARHAAWLESTRDADESGMIDVVDQYETGQEYMSRYQAVDPQADRYGWENRLRLKGVDVTTYAYALVRALADLAPRAGCPQEQSRWLHRAERMAGAMRGRMWDPQGQMFSDIDPRSGERTGVRAAVCFYPYFTDVAAEEHLEGFLENLLDPTRFWTPFPVPSSALDDPLFSAVAEWKGKRHVCPWNGRVWPMANSHIVDALGRWATPDRPRVRSALATLLTRFVRMMFHDGDVALPNCFEHYNPMTGAASVYRGIDDYQHSWVVDLIVQYVAGLRPQAGGIVVDPMPFGIDAVSLEGVRVRDRRIDIAVTGESFMVSVNGVRHASRMGEPIALEW